MKNIVEKISKNDQIDVIVIKVLTILCLIVAMVMLLIDGIFLVFTLLPTSVLQDVSGYSYEYDLQTLKHNASFGNYTDLSQNVAMNRTVDYEASDEMLQYYALADYYDAAILYYADIDIDKNAAIMEQARKDAGDMLQIYIEEIDEMFQQE